MQGLFFILIFWWCATDALTLPVENKVSKVEVFDAVNTGSKGLAAFNEAKSQGKSPRFFGGTPPLLNPTGGFFPNSPSPYNFGGFQPPPYFSPYGYMNGPFNYGSFYPINPSFYGNSFGGFSSTQQQQQQQQVSQIGTSGLQPTFSG